MQQVKTQYYKQLIFNILQFCKNKKLMQAQKSACRSEKKVVILHRVRQANRKE